jgi:protein-S-isoprenylcysteine O-methyltransferase Ste14
MYLGMTGFLAGFAVILGSVSSFVPVILFAWIIDRHFIRNEEAFLLDTFGKDYREYMRRVRRWI